MAYKKTTTGTVQGGRLCVMKTLTFYLFSGVGVNCADQSAAKSKTAESIF